MFQENPVYVLSSTVKSVSSSLVTGAGVSHTEKSPVIADSSIMDDFGDMAGVQGSNYVEGPNFATAGPGGADLDLVGPGQVVEDNDPVYAVADVPVGSGSGLQGVVGPGEEDPNQEVDPAVDDVFQGYDIFQYLDYFGEVLHNWFLFFILRVIKNVGKCLDICIYT